VIDAFVPLRRSRAGSFAHRGEDLDAGVARMNLKRDIGSIRDRLMEVVNTFSADLHQVDNFGADLWVCPHQVHSVLE
jgi:hypothetical protein